MPYIRRDARPRIDARMSNLLKDVVHGPAIMEGEMNYIITTLVWEYVKQRGGNYAAFNAAFGILSCVTQELYRRKLASYEDGKVEANGDVYC